MRKPRPIRSEPLTQEYWNEELRLWREFSAQRQRVIDAMWQAGREQQPEQQEDQQ